MSRHLWHADYPCRSPDSAADHGFVEYYRCYGCGGDRLRPFKYDTLTLWGWFPTVGERWYCQDCEAFKPVIAVEQIQPWED